jgi:hypothetical protein
LTRRIWKESYVPKSDLDWLAEAAEDVVEFEIHDSVSVKNWPEVIEAILLRWSEGKLRAEV